MIDELIKGIKESIQAPPSQKGEKFYGVVVGTVVNPVDLYMLGRVQVWTPFVDSLDLSPWARVAQAMAGPLHGTYFIPNIGDEVLLAFEHGDTNAPYILGSLANLVSRPPLPSPLPQIRAIRTLAGNQIVFEEIPPTITIQTAPTPPVAMPAPLVPGAPYASLQLSGVKSTIQATAATKITLEVLVNSIKVAPDEITLEVLGSKITLSATGITLEAPTIQVKGNALVLIKGNPVSINP